MSRSSAKLGRRADTLVDTNDPPLAIGVQNGKATAYFYPGFILVVRDAGADFAIVDLKDLDISYCNSNFTETEAVPSDSIIVRKVWAKSNKNGSRDRRFKDNRELPVMLYGEMELKGPGNMHEVFMFSRNEACRDFVSAVKNIQIMLRSSSMKRFGIADKLIRN